MWCCPCDKIEPSLTLLLPWAIIKLQALRTGGVLICGVDLTGGAASSGSGTAVVTALPGGTSTLVLIAAALKVNCILLYCLGLAAIQTPSPFPLSPRHLTSITFASHQARPFQLTRLIPPQLASKRIFSFASVIICLQSLCCC